MVSDAVASRVPVNRSRSARAPASNPSARKPNRLVASTYCANRGAGRPDSRSTAQRGNVSSVVYWLRTMLR